MLSFVRLTPITSGESRLDPADDVTEDDIAADVVQEIVVIPVV